MKKIQLFLAMGLLVSTAVTLGADELTKSAKARAAKKARADALAAAPAEPSAKEKKDADLANHIADRGIMVYIADSATSKWSGQSKTFQSTDSINKVKSWITSFTGATNVSLAALTTARRIKDNTQRIADNAKVGNIPGKDSDKTAVYILYTRPGTNAAKKQADEKGKGGVPVKKSGKNPPSAPK